MVFSITPFFHSPLPDSLPFPDAPGMFRETGPYFTRSYLTMSMTTWPSAKNEIP